MPKKPHWTQNRKQMTLTAYVVVYGPSSMMQFDRHEANDAFKYLRRLGSRATGYERRIVVRSGQGKYRDERARKESGE